jgi:carbamoylphosphate synthase large subunit
MQRTVLITSVGSGVGLGIIQALRASGKDYRVIGLNSEAMAAGPFLCDAAYLAPPTAEGDAFTENLLEIARIESPQLVLPGRDLDLPALAKAAPDLNELGMFVLVPGPEAILACNDKLATNAAVRDAGQHFAETAADHAGILALAESAGFPLVAKPRFGHSSMGVNPLFTVGDLEKALAAGGNTVVQKLLLPFDLGKSRGDVMPVDVMLGGRLKQANEYSIQVFVGRDGQVLGTFATRNQLVHGAPMVIETVHHAGLIQACTEIANHLAGMGLVGPLNLQAVRTGPEEFTFFEANARFTGITPVRAAMGFHEVHAAYEHFVLGRDPADLLESRNDQAACRYLTQSVITADDYKKLQKEGHWPGSS